MNRVICIELWKIANNSISFSFCKIIKYLFTCKNVSRMDTSAEILSTSGSNGRKDHMDLYKQVIKKLGNKTVFNDPDSWEDINCFHPIMIFRVMFLSLSILKDSDLFFKQKVDLTSEVIYYCNTLLALRKLDFSKTKKYLCEIDVRRFENLMTQYMQLKNIPTFSMEEGIFYIFKGEIPHDSVHYEVLTTDKLLCWSQYVIDEFSQYGIEKDRLILAGYPKKVERKNIKKSSSLKKCLVMVARKQFDSANYKLLDILKSMTNQYDFCLKLHPSCDYHSYEQYALKNGMYIINKETTLIDCLQQDCYNWAIAVNTTAYYETLMKGIPCFRFLDESYSLPNGGDDSFETRGELETLLEMFKHSNTEIYQKDIDEMLTYTIGIGIDNYSKAICG